MNYYEPMGFYDDGYGETFFPVIYVREDGVLERQLELLRQVGWKIIELSCEKFLKSSGSEEDAMIVFEAIEFPDEIPRIPEDWIHEYLEDLHWLDLSQGFFFVLKDYDVFFQDQEKLTISWRSGLQSCCRQWIMIRGTGILGLGMRTTIHRMCSMAWRCLGPTLIRCWSFLRVGRLWCLSLMKMTLELSIQCMLRIRKILLGVGEG